MPLKIILLLLLVCLSGFTPSIQAQDNALDPSRVKWSSLHYKSYVLFFPMNVKARLTELSQTDSKSALLIPKQGQGTMPQADPTYRIDIDSKLMGRDSFISLWFDPDGNAFQRTQTDTGSKQRVKTYRILTNGYYSREIKPKENEKALSPNQWTQIGEGYKTFNKLPPTHEIVAEPTALYYLVSASALTKPGDKFQKLIFTKYGIYQLNLHAVDYQVMDTNYIQQRGENKQTIQGEYQTLHIKMNAVPIDPSGTDKFDFLGLKGDIHLYLDPVSRVLLQISGKADIIGHTDITLKHVVF